MSDYGSSHGKSTSTRADRIAEADLAQFPAWLEEKMVGLGGEPCLETLAQVLEHTHDSLKLARQFGTKLIDRTYPDIRRAVVARYITVGGDVGPPLSLSRFNDFYGEAPKVAETEAEAASLHQHHEHREQCHCLPIFPNEQSPQFAAVSKLRRFIDSGVLSKRGVLATPEVYSLSGYYTRNREDKNPLVASKERLRSVVADELYFGAMAIVLPEPAAAQKDFLVYKERLHGPRTLLTIPCLSFLAQSRKTSLCFDTVSAIVDFLRSGVRIGHIDFENAIHPVNSHSEDAYYGRPRENLMRDARGSTFSRAAGPPVVADIPELLNKYPILQAAESGGSVGRKLMCCFGGGGAESIDALSEADYQDSISFLIAGIHGSGHFCESFTGLSMPNVALYDISLTTSRIVEGVRQIILGCDLVHLSLRGIGFCKRSNPGVLASGLADTTFDRFIKSLKKCVSLEHVDLSSNYFGDELGDRVLSNVLSGVRLNGTQLRVLEMAENNLGASSAQTLTNLVEFTSLVKLDISRNCIVGESFKTLVAGMKRRQSIQTFTFWENERDGEKLSVQLQNEANKAVEAHSGSQLVMQVLANMYLVDSVYVQRAATGTDSKLEEVSYISGEL